MTDRGRSSLPGDVWRKWRQNGVAHLGAALAYYALFSLVPLLAIGLAAAQEVFGEQAARAEFIRQLENLLGEPGAPTLQRLLFEVRPFSTTALGTATSFAVLLWAAHLVFSQLKASLNIVWGARPQRHPVKHFIMVRLVSLVVVSAFVILLLVLFSLTTILSALSRRAPQALPAPALLLQGFDFVASVGLTTLILALIYKLLPDVRIFWRDVFGGAVCTALLLATGKALLGAYFSRVNLASVYGAAVTVIVALVAVFFYAQILLFGAVLTEAWAARRRVRAGAP